MHTLNTLDELKQKSPICLKCFYRAQINSSIFIWKLFNSRWTVFSMKRLLFPKLFRINKAITCTYVLPCVGFTDAQVSWCFEVPLPTSLHFSWTIQIKTSLTETLKHFLTTCIFCYNIISNKKRFFFSKCFSFTSSIFKIDLKHTTGILRKRLQSISI